MNNQNLVWVKALLLEESAIKLSEDISIRKKEEFLSTENLYSIEQIFLELGDNVKVRLNVSSKSKYVLMQKDGYHIVDCENGHYIIQNIKIINFNSALLHSPQQALFNLYKKCSRNCAYCPLPQTRKNVEFMREEAFKEIIPQLDFKQIRGIGFTTGIPEGWTEDKLVSELVSIIRTIKDVGGKDVYISAAPPPMNKDNLKKLKYYGLNEIRINIEVYNEKIFKKMCPGFKFENTIESIINASEIFGKNKVSTNMVIGLGESDDDVVNGINFFAQYGVLSTLSPLDIVPERKKYLEEIMGKVPKRPTAERIYKLALKQKRIYDQYKITLNNGIRTMCSACGFCNIAPLVDF